MKVLRVTIFARILAPVLMLILARTASASPPRAPFSGLYGATSGAGATVGWDRLGGDNPAVLAAPGWVASAAGYSPFGVDGLRVIEAAAAWDRPRWGLSAFYRSLSGNLVDDGAQAVAGLQSAVRIGGGWVLGGAGAYPLGAEADARAEALPELSAGVSWRPRGWGSLAAFARSERSVAGVSGAPPRFGAGADAGARLGSFAWRLCAESSRAYSPAGPRWEHRFGAGLRLHARLSVQAGWDAARETASLGARFGMAGWEGFSAMRRHAALGGYSVQGLRARREAKP